MAPKPRAKAGARAKGKAGRRPPVKVRRAGDLPILPIAVGGILLALAIAMIAYIVYSNRPSAPPPTAAGVPCDSLEHTQVHYHAALQIVYQGSVVNLPDNIGINPGNASCYYWLHVHAGDKNVIHIESPKSETFTLGQFFDVWRSWATASDQPVPQFDATHVATFTISPDQKVVVYVDVQDGKGPQLYTGDLKSIVLEAHEVITVEITPPQVSPPSLTFPNGE